MRRVLTPEQQAARDARRAAFKQLWGKVAKMSDEQKQAMLSQVGAAYITCEGHALSLCNSMLIALQRPGASVLGGFRQWLKHGRAVRKGEHGAMIWVPIGRKEGEATATTESSTETSTEGDSRPGFIVGTVFDVNQTEEVQAA